MFEKHREKEKKHNQKNLNAKTYSRSVAHGEERREKKNKKARNGKKQKQKKKKLKLPSEQNVVYLEFTKPETGSSKLSVVEFRFDFALEKLKRESFRTQVSEQQQHEDHDQ